jgi:hypothetical protein
MKTILHFLVFIFSIYLLMHAAYVNSIIVSGVAFIFIILIL